jgi:hypothetical protein
MAGSGEMECNIGFIMSTLKKSRLLDETMSGSERNRITTYEWRVREMLGMFRYDLREAKVMLDSIW